MQNRTSQELQAHFAEYCLRAMNAAPAGDAIAPEARSPIPAPHRIGDLADVLEAPVRRNAQSVSDLIGKEAPTWERSPSQHYSQAIKIIEMPDIDVACVRFIGPYDGVEKSLKHLHDWAAPLGLFGPGCLLFAAMHDVPGIVPQKQLRSDACIQLSPGHNLQPKAPVYFQRLSCAGQYACGHFEFTDPAEFPCHWYEVALNWMPRHHREFDDRPMLEIFHSNPMDGQGFKVDLCVPVVAS